MTIKESLKIGVFDSGIGGFSLLRPLREKAPDCLVHYIADSAFGPYGQKSESFIIERCEILAKELIENRGVDTLLLACNTATSIGIEHLRKLYPEFPIIGIEPFINYINLNDKLSSKRGAILVTPMMNDSERFEKLREKLDPSKKLKSHSCPNLAVIVEKKIKGELSEKGFLNELSVELKEIKGLYDYLILGCTHYPLIEKEISELLNARVISPSAQVIEQLLKINSYQVTSQIPSRFEFLETIENEKFSWRGRDWDEIF